MRIVFTAPHTEVLDANDRSGDQCTSDIARFLFEYCRRSRFDCHLIESSQHRSIKDDNRREAYIAMTPLWRKLLSLSRHVPSILVDVHSFHASPRHEWSVDNALCVFYTTCVLSRQLADKVQQVCHMRNVKCSTRGYIPQQGTKAGMYIIQHCSENDLFDSSVLIEFPLNKNHEHDIRYRLCVADAVKAFAHSLKLEDGKVITQRWTDEVPCSARRKDVCTNESECTWQQGKCKRQPHEPMSNPISLNDEEVKFCDCILHVNHEKKHHQTAARICASTNRTSTGKKSCNYDIDKVPVALLRSYALSRRRKLNLEASEILRSDEVRLRNLVKAAYQEE